MTRLSGDVRASLPRILLIGVASVAIAVVAGWASRPLSEREPGAAEMPQLVAAATTERATDGRLTGGLHSAAARASKRIRPISLTEESRLAIARLEQFPNDPAGGTGVQVYFAHARVQGWSSARRKPDLSASDSFMVRDMTFSRSPSMPTAFAAGMTASLRSLDGWSAGERTNKPVRKCFIDHGGRSV
jgi:hypothetical protein